MNGKKAGIIAGFVILIVIIIGLVLALFLKEEPEMIYKVIFNNEGTIEIVSVKESLLVPKPTVPTKEGYTFDGWYYNGAKFDFTTGITEDIVLNARWLDEAAKKWTVTFDSVGGDYIEKLTVIDGDKIEQIPTPEKEGYTFDAWYYNNKKFDFNTAITKNILLVAEWEKNETEEDAEETTVKYTVKFDSAEGSKVASKTVEKGNTIAKPSDPTRNGYVFIGWYNGNQKFDFKTKITSNITLTAKWKKVETTTEPEKATYTVTFDTAGGSSIASKQATEGETVTKPSNPTRDGYTFIGWYYNNAQYNFSTVITSNITLTAKWEKNSVISYKIEEIAESYVGQVRVFVLKDGTKVAGTVDITTTSGKVVTKDIPAEGYVTNGAIIKSITNIRVK